MQVSDIQGVKVKLRKRLPKLEKMVVKIPDVVLSWCIKNQTGELLLFLLITDYLRGTEIELHLPVITRFYRDIWGLSATHVKQIMFRMRKFAKTGILFSYEADGKRFIFGSKYEWMSRVPRCLKAEYDCVWNIRLDKLRGYATEKYMLIKMIKVLAYNRVFPDSQKRRFSRLGLNLRLGMNANNQNKFEKEYGIYVKSDYMVVGKERVGEHMNPDNRHMSKVFVKYGKNGQRIHMVRLPNVYRMVKRLRVMERRKVQGKSRKKLSKVIRGIRILEKENQRNRVQARQKALANDTGGSWRSDIAKGMIEVEVREDRYLVNIGLNRVVKIAKDDFLQTRARVNKDFDSVDNSKKKNERWEFIKSWAREYKFQVKKIYEYGDKWEHTVCWRKRKTKGLFKVGKLFCDEFLWKPEYQFRERMI